MAETLETADLRMILERLRKMRDTWEMSHEIRQHYNVVCDRLDVLISKIDQRRT